MPSPPASTTTSFPTAGPSRQQHQQYRDPQQQYQDHHHHHLQNHQGSSQTYGYQKQHRLSRSFPTSTSHLAAPRYPTPTGTRSDRQQAPVSSSLGLGSRLDTGSGTGTGTGSGSGSGSGIGIGIGTSFSRKTPSPLPRTSSLLPPPQLAPSQSSTTQFDALNPDAAIDPDSYLRARPTTSHSRSSSAALSTDGVRNLNRWSASTASSRASGPNHHASSFHARRVSVDASSFLANQSPQRLPRTRRRSNSSDASRGPFGGGSRLRGYSPPGPTRAGGLSTVFSTNPLDYTPATEPTASSAQPSASRAFGGGHFAEQNQPWDAFTGQGRSGSVEQPPRTMMQSDRNGEAYDSRGHSRNRSQAAKGSSDTTSSRRSDKGNKPPSQKAMLSRALQKANTAVQLDNAQNFEGARQAYAEACELLHQVLARTSTEEDRRKLEAIRRTYTSRIEELDQMAPIQVPEGKALPARPESLGLRLNPSLQFDDDDDLEESGGLETAALNRIIKDGSRSSPNYGGSGLPISRMQGLAEPPRSISARTPEQYPLQSSFSRSPLRERTSDDHLIFQIPTDDANLPPPLSPRRPASPKLDGRSSPDAPVRSDFSLPATRIGQSPKSRHIRDTSRESNSWLDPIDESGGSNSSVHSRSSSMKVRRKHIRAPSGATEAEFDAALDAAVEAAYDDGYEPMDFSDQEASYVSDDQVVANALRKVELAKERVRQTEREVFEQANGRDQKPQEQPQYDGDVTHEDFYDDGSSDEEERILEEMTRGYSIDDFSFTQGTRQPPARNSGSSDVAHGSWQMPSSSNTAAGGDVSSSPTDAFAAANFPRAGSFAAPPPVQSLPELPAKPTLSGAAFEPGQTVRSRRMSGQNPKQLKIETTKLSTFGDPGRRFSVAQPNDRDQGVDFNRQDSGAPNGGNGAMFRPYSPPEGVSPTQPVPPTPPPLGHRSRDSEDFAGSHAGSPMFKPTLRKNFSSNSLRSMKNRNMSLSNLEDASDMSPGTPLSSAFGINGRHPPLPTPLAAAFRDKFSSTSAGGMYLFDDSLHSPQSPGSPNEDQVDAPASLEPCPTDYMLRPFWLMRCLYQTLAHPRGGYLSNKLFVPRDVWKVKGVKIRNVEDKVATCDYLTAALLKLARVDTLDADAVLEEMQSLENILEQVQASLTRKLGTEVGVQTSNVIFRDASNSAEIEAAINVPRSASVTGKSSFSWRRLRSKGSAAGLNNSFNAKSAGPDSGKESPTLETLPMTEHPTSKPAKRDPTSAQFTGPNANYMGSLARLFDAAQTIDQIARQVEDPGLRHADKTQVGLELCTRHAAEFFGFFICRFVLSDLSMLLDKFIKRGSEWVLA